LTGKRRPRPQPIRVRGSNEIRPVFRPAGARLSKLVAACPSSPAPRALAILCRFGLAASGPLCFPRFFARNAATARTHRIIAEVSNFLRAGPQSVNCAPVVKQGTASLRFRHLLRIGIFQRASMDCKNDLSAPPAGSGPPRGPFFADLRCRNGLSIPRCKKGKENKRRWAGALGGRSTSESSSTRKRFSSGAEARNFAGQESIVERSRGQCEAPVRHRTVLLMESLSRATYWFCLATKTAPEPPLMFQQYHEIQ